MLHYGRALCHCPTSLPGVTPLTYQQQGAVVEEGVGGGGGERGAAIPVSVCDVCVCVFLHCQ